MPRSGSNSPRRGTEGNSPRRGTEGNSPRRGIEGNSPRRCHECGARLLMDERSECAPCQVATLREQIKRAPQALAGVLGDLLSEILRNSPRPSWEFWAWEESAA